MQEILSSLSNILEYFCVYLIRFCESRSMEPTKKMPRKYRACETKAFAFAKYGSENLYRVRLNEMNIFFRHTPLTTLDRTPGPRKKSLTDTRPASPVFLKENIGKRGRVRGRPKVNQDMWRGMKRNPIMSSMTLHVSSYGHRTFPIFVKHVVHNYQSFQMQKCLSATQPYQLPDWEELTKTTFFL